MRSTGYIMPKDIALFTATSAFADHEEQAPDNSRNGPRVVDHSRPGSAAKYFLASVTHLCSLQRTIVHVGARYLVREAVGVEHRVFVREELIYSATSWPFTADFGDFAVDPRTTGLLRSSAPGRAGPPPCGPLCEEHPQQHRRTTPPTQNWGPSSLKACRIHSLLLRE